MNSEYLNYKVLVAGSGSIGKRHMRNLRAIGIKQLAACDTDPERLAPMVAELGIQPFPVFGYALEAFRPAVVFVCTPPIFHIPQAIEAVRHGAHVFIEKPLSSSLEQVDELIQEVTMRQLIVQVGYNLRFHPGLIKIKQLMEEDAVGRILWARAEVGQYLPDWRPGQDYRQSYTARQDLGGGIILDGSHELDYVIWLLGQPSELICMAGRTSDLQVDVEDCATVLLRFPNGAQADIHMDFIQRHYARTCKLVGTRGTIWWDFSENQLKWFEADQRHWDQEHFDFEFGNTYVAEVEFFLNSIVRKESGLDGLQEACQVLRVVLTARQSALEGKWVNLA